MNLSMAHVRLFLADVPRQGALAYCLLRDERVPLAPKGALLAALALIVSPFDLPNWVPVLGELDMVALAVLAVKVFVEACPEELVAEHETALKAKNSLLHQDLRSGTRLAREGAGWIVDRWRARRSRSLRVVREEEPA
jgi:uncharacterized membrane protein YkvA (DUF1232 family)